MNRLKNRQSRARSCRHRADTVPPNAKRQLLSVARAVLSHDALNGASVALGLLVVSAAVHLVAGAFAAAVAGVGVIVCIMPDRAAPRRGKLLQLLPAALFGLPAFTLVHAVRGDPIVLGAVLVAGSFVAFLAGAWGRLGRPLTASLAFAMVFALAVQAPGFGTAQAAAAFASGAALYVVWAVLANAVLNARYRTQVLAETVLALSALMRTQAGRYVPGAGSAAGKVELVRGALRRQSALSELMQLARDLLLEAPRTPRRVQRAAMLMQILEMRDRLIACGLDADDAQREAANAPWLDLLHVRLQAVADELDALADALLLARRAPARTAVRSPLSEWTPEPGMPAAVLMRSVVRRVGQLDDDARQLTALARGDAAPDLAAVQSAWRLFVSPIAWSWRPLVAALRPDAPVLRHALRAALAFGCAYTLTLLLPWGGHGYWVLLTIVVVLRGSLAQTIERRNSRVGGTLLGCVGVAALLWTQPPHALLLLTVTLAQAVAHAFVMRRYFVTAVAATVLGLVQAHLLAGGADPVFDVVERLVDTLLGAAIAWLFSYVLPSWERDQLPKLVALALRAQARHARLALALDEQGTSEIEWRLARREVHDSLAALVQSVQRSLVEPRAVRPPLRALGRLLARDERLLVQLTAVKSMLLRGGDRLDAASLRAPLARGAQAIETSLLAPREPATQPLPAAQAAELPIDPAGVDLGPWVLRRIDLAQQIALRLRDDAEEVRRSLAATD
ncbi:MAG: FUSC family protein [Burkholderiales bacterium]|nr:FUSC family protein [Burkholderiales bacterium]